MKIKNLIVRNKFTAGELNLFIVGLIILFTDNDSMETTPPTRRLVKEVTGVVRDGISELPKG